MSIAIPAKIDLHDGFWWPRSDSDARPVIMADVGPDIAALMPHVLGRDLIVQAGANVGVYPLALADLFQRVVTVEPDAANFECLTRNLLARDSLHRVVALRAAFGAEEGRCSVVETKFGNCGAHHVDYAGAEVRVRAIDDLRLHACDCIWLDVEGAELPALRGAVQTILDYSPTIALEDKGLGREFFGQQLGAVQAFLADLGYSEVARFGRDKIFRRAT